MGADIHMFLERRRDSSLPWELDPSHVEDEDGMRAQISCTHRHYVLFGVLAGVRGSDCIYDPRGIPRDATAEIVEEFGRYGEHTPHWLTLSEFIECLRAIRYQTSSYDVPEIVFEWEKYGLNKMPGYWSIVRYAEKYIEDATADNILLGTNYRPEVRLVFWFDS